MRPIRAIVSTYHKDRTFAVTVAGRKLNEQGAMTGDWKLDGDRLITVSSAFTNNFGAETIPLTAFNSATNRIVKLTDSEMIWRNSGQWTGFKLKRIALSPSVAE